MSEQLKPCPFCGSEVISDGWVGCLNKDCDLAFSIFGVSIDVWNNRPGEAKARREALKEARDKIQAQVDLSPGDHIHDKRYRTGLHDGVDIIDFILKEKL